MGDFRPARLGLNPTAGFKIGIQVRQKQRVSRGRAPRNHAATHWIGEKPSLTGHDESPAGQKKTGHPLPSALFHENRIDQATEGASSAVMSITAGSSSGTSTSAFTLMLRCRSKPVPAGMMWPMMTFSLKPRR